MKRFCRWAGSGAVGLAVALLAAFFFSPFTPHGFVQGGKVEGGRYFVVGKGHRYTEVSETRWRIGQYVECAFPWLPVMLVWVGVGLRTAPDADPAPAAPPPTRNAVAELTVAFGAVLGAGVVAAVRCSDTGVPWPVGLGVWLALCVGLLFLAGVAGRPRSSAAPDAAGV